MNVPPNWGRDPLTAYLQDYRGNQLAVFVHKDAQVSALVTIDGLFLKLLHGAVNPSPILPMTFLLRAHSAFRASVAAVMAGQLYETQALLRLCLEHGAYGFYIGADTKRWERWMRRSDSENAKQVVRDEFTHNKIRKYILANAPTLGRKFQALYDRLIDFGAHPNEQGFSLNSAIRREQGNVHLDTIYLHADGVPLDLALKSTGQVGLWVLHIGQVLYPERYELQGIRAELELVKEQF